MKKNLKLMGTLTLVVVMMTMLFAGCGSDSNSTANGAAVSSSNEGNSDTSDVSKSDSSDAGSVDASSKEPLTVLVALDGLALEKEKEVFAKYTEETGQEFEFITVAYDDLEKKLGTMISGGEPPALIRGTAIHSTKFADRFVPLDLDTSYMVPYFFYNSDGDIISLPTELTTVGMYINTDLADKYDVNYPTSPDDVWTWEEFETEMKKLVGQPDVDFPMVMDGSGHRYSPMFYQQGGLIYGGDFNDFAIDSPESIYSLENFKRLVDEKIIDPQTYSIGTSGDGLFTTGRYAIHMSGSWMIQRYAEGLDFNYDVTYMPQGDGGRATVLGGSSYHACKDSGREDDALAVIMWMAKKENLINIGQTITQLTAVKDAEVDYGEYTDHFTKFGNEMSATDGKYINDFSEFSRVPGAYNYVKDAIIEVLGEMKTPEQALNDAAEYLKQAAADAGIE